MNDNSKHKPEKPHIPPAMNRHQRRAMTKKMGKSWKDAPIQLAVPEITPLLRVKKGLYQRS